MNDLVLIRKENFNGVECDLYKNENMDIFMTREQIGRALEYSNPIDAIKNVHLRNKERLDTLSVKFKMSGTDGKLYDSYVYSAKGIYEICRWSKQPKANDFYDWVYELIENIRIGNIKIQYSIPQTYAEALLLAGNLQKQVDEFKPKAEIYDEIINSNGLFNFKQIADMIGCCGRNTLMKILRKRKILSESNHNKNLPYYQYEKSGLFIVKITPRKTNNGLEPICTTLCTSKSIPFIKKLIEKEKTLLGSVDS